MTKKTVLLATLLAGMSAFTGCEKKAAKGDSTAQEEQIQHFEKVSKSIPIFRDELPHAMILNDGKGGYVQMLYPAKMDGSVLEDKDQYEKRVKWLNEKCPVDIPQPGLSLRGCKWVDYPRPPKSPYVSIFDKKEYIYQHINWMQGFYKSGNQHKINYSPEKDPIVLWWIAQSEFHKSLEKTTNKKVSNRSFLKER